MVLTIINRISKRNGNLHQVRTIVERRKVNTLTVRNQSHLVLAKILENVICVGFKVEKRLGKHLHC